MNGSPRTLVLMVFAMLSWPILAMAQPPADCGHYAYGGGSEGRHCGGASGSPPAQRVTAICRDQTYSYEVGSWTCQDHGGVKTWMR